MDELGVEREGQPIISNIFPVSKDSVLTAFRELNFQEEKDLLGKSNPNVLTDIEQLIEPYKEKKAKQMFWGAMLFHRALREQAESKGMTLPAFTEQFIEDYEEQKESSAEESRIEAVRHRRLSNEEAAREFRRRNIAIFRNLEPQFSRIVEGEFGAQPNWAPEDDDRYKGIIYEYLLFREGLSGPKNFQQQIPTK